MGTEEKGHLDKMSLFTPNDNVICFVTYHCVQRLFIPGYLYYPFAWMSCSMNIIVRVPLETQQMAIRINGTNALIWICSWKSCEAILMCLEIIILLPVAGWYNFQFLLLLLKYLYYCIRADYKGILGSWKTGGSYKILFIFVIIFIVYVF